MMFFIIKMSFVLLFWYIAGHYPEWDEDHPIHFVGHSAGAQVVRVLQQMLADKVSLDLNAMFFFLHIWIVYKVVFDFGINVCVRLVIFN
jgi:hypothetical protein